MTVDEKIQISEAARNATGVDQEATRLCEPVYTLQTGRARDAAIGLQDRMDVDHAEFFGLVAKEERGIEEELTNFAQTLPQEEATLIKDWLHYVLEEETSEKLYPNGIRDQGRVNFRFEDFCSHPNATEAGLKKAGVLALRLYTTPLFKYFNGPLRDDQRHSERKPCPLPVTTHFAVDGIRKLRALNLECASSAEQQKYPKTLWRGMRNREFAAGFRVEGGTELGFMSTSTDAEVAVKYSLSRQSLLFKLVARNFLSTGANLKWLSAFPAESEIVFPPLTYLQPTGRTDEIIVEKEGQQLCFTIVEVEPSLG